MPFVSNHGWFQPAVDYYRIMYFPRTLAKVLMFQVSAKMFQVRRYEKLDRHVVLRQETGCGPQDGSTCLALLNSSITVHVDSFLAKLTCNRDVFWAHEHVEEKAKCNRLWDKTRMYEINMGATIAILNPNRFDGWGLQFERMAAKAIRRYVFDAPAA